MKQPSAAARTAGLAFLVSAGASIGLAVVYLLGGHPQAEGALLAVALGGIATGLIVWASRLMPGGRHDQPRHVPPPGSQRPQEAAEAFRGESDRRTFLGRLLMAALAALGAAALFPVRSLGTRPGATLHRTAWRAGLRLVTANGELVRAGDLRPGAVLTVFPEGHTDAADSPALLIKLRPDEYDPPPGREDWAPDGFVAYSKICTHAGCPVGLYQPETQQLFCPCHQSVFAVLQAARPTAGPATRALPQLPLDLRDGYLAARGDFPEPIGPAFWNMDRDPRA